jgi:hypothetical protein
MKDQLKMPLLVVVLCWWQNRPVFYPEQNAATATSQYAAGVEESDQSMRNNKR